ncbi:ABC transporter ATP-binding protein [bacterium]|nr:ABC transporter ATP-binding protein [bacterium]
MNITIDGLSKTYRGGIQALKRIDLKIEQGLFGLLGPNGAGKTTLMRILVTLLEPSTGTARYGELDLKRDRARVRACLGYLPQQFSTFPKLRTWEFLSYAASLAGLRGAARRGAVERMLETVGLYEARDRMAGKLSGGMKRRLGIAQALIGEPRVLVVDEPTVGLDPEERLRFRNILSEMSSRDMVILLSTHIVGDISSSCERMAMLNHGELVYDGSPEALVAATRGHAWLVHALDSELDNLRENWSVISTVPAADGWEVQVVGDKPDGFNAEPIEPNLEHAYVHFLEQKLGEKLDHDDAD